MFCSPASCVATCWVQLASADDGVLGGSSVPSVSANDAECCHVVAADARSFGDASVKACCSCC